MRTSILIWSTASGAIIGLFMDAALLGVAVLAATLIPSLGARVVQHRWIAATALVVLATIPLALSVLGFLEGRLKSV